MSLAKPDKSEITQRPMPAAHVAEQPLPGTRPDTSANEDDEKVPEAEHPTSSRPETLKKDEFQRNGSDNEQGGSTSTENRCALKAWCCAKSLYSLEYRSEVSDFGHNFCCQQ